MNIYHSLNSYIQLNDLSKPNYYYYYAAMGLFPALLGTQFLISSSTKETVQAPDKNLYTCTRSPKLVTISFWAYLTISPPP